LTGRVDRRRDQLDERESSVGADAGDTPLRRLDPDRIFGIVEKDPDRHRGASVGEEGRGGDELGGGGGEGGEEEQGGRGRSEKDHRVLGVCSRARHLSRRRGGPLSTGCEDRRDGCRPEAGVVSPDRWGSPWTFAKTCGAAGPRPWAPGRG